MRQLHNFDTHSAIKKLVAAGLKDKAAEEIVQTMVLSRDSDLSNLVTKEEFFKAQRTIDKRFNDVDKKFNDVDKRFDAVDKEIALLKKDVIAEIAKSKAETIKWLVGLFIAAAIAYFTKSHF